MAEFFEIWGGSPRLQLPGVWFHWVNTAMMLAAWRKVGFAGGRIDPTLIDRTHFIDRIDVGSPSKATRSIMKAIEEVVKTPPGMRSGSLAAMAAKFEAAVAHSQELRDALEAANACGFDPETVPFLMKPKELAAKAKRDRSQVDMSIYEGGSASLRNVRKSLDAKREAQADAAAAVEGRKAARAGKQAVVSAAAEQLVADYERCALRCTCGQKPCPVADMSACLICKAAGRLWIKSRACMVRECVAARKGAGTLLLTHKAGTSDDSSPAPSIPTSDDEEDGADDNEVMPVAKRPAVAAVTMCDWACMGGCDNPELTAEEVDLGYCSGRRCKAKMHPECFLRHAGEAGGALDDLTCFCRGCWAAQ